MYYFGKKKREIQEKTKLNQIGPSRNLGQNARYKKK